MQSDFQTLKENLGSSNNELIDEGISEIEELYQYLIGTEALQKMRFAPYLARGIDIYTGTVWELFLKDRNINGKEFNVSVGGGGRYDKIITSFIDDGKEYPAVGMSFGLDVIYQILTLKNSDKGISTVDLFVIPLGTDIASFKFTSQMRKIGVRTEIEKRSQKLKKSMAYANAINVPYVIILGENELQAQKVKLRNMNNGEETEFQMNDYEGIKSFIVSS